MLVVGSSICDKNVARKSACLFCSTNTSVLPTPDSRQNTPQHYHSLFTLAGSSFTKAATVHTNFCTFCPVHTVDTVFELLKDILWQVKNRTERQVKLTYDWSKLMCK